MEYKTALWVVWDLGPSFPRNLKELSKIQQRVLLSRVGVTFSVEIPRWELRLGTW